MSLGKPVIAVIGAGAVGGYYGARLVQGGFDVHLLARSDCASIQQHGLQIKSSDGDFSLSPEQIQVYADAREMPPADLILVTLKTTANQSLRELIEPILKPDSIILTIQNGLGNEQLLAQHFGAQRVLGGMAFVCINRIGPGIISHTDHGLIRIGEMLGPASDRVRRIAGIFEASRITCKTTDDLAKGRWEKLIWNIPFNGLGAAMDLTTDRLIASPVGIDLVSRLMLEVIATARELGIVFELSIVKEKIQHTQTMGAYKTSMQIDRQMGRPMEIETIIGQPLGVAKAHGVSTPVLRMVYDMLVVLESGASQ